MRCCWSDIFIKIIMEIEVVRSNFWWTIVFYSDFQFTYEFWYNKRKIIADKEDRAMR